MYMFLIASGFSCLHNLTTLLKIITFSASDGTLILSSLAVSWFYWCLQSLIALIVWRVTSTCFWIIEVIQSILSFCCEAPFLDGDFSKLCAMRFKHLLAFSFSSFVTWFAKTWHNGAFLEIQIFASVSSIYLKLCSVATPMLYCKHFLSYKAR